MYSRIRSYDCAMVLGNRGLNFLPSRPIQHLMFLTFDDSELPVRILDSSTKKWQDGSQPFELPEEVKKIRLVRKSRETAVAQASLMPRLFLVAYTSSHVHHSWFFSLENFRESLHNFFEHQTTLPIHVSRNLYVLWETTAKAWTWISPRFFLPRRVLTLKQLATGAPFPPMEASRTSTTRSNLKPER